MAAAFRACCISALLLLVLPVTAYASEGGGNVNPAKPDYMQAIFSIVVFVLLLIILRQAAWRPMLAALKQREDSIRDAIEGAKRDREAAEARLAEYEQKLLAARDEASAIVDEGRRDAEVLKRKLEDDARREASAMVERAKREIEAATDTAIKELYDVSSDLATHAASKIIRKELNPEDHRNLIAESIEQLGRIEKN